MERAGHALAVGSRRRQRPLRRWAGNAELHGPSTCCQASPIERGLELARTRLSEASQQTPLLLDPYAQALCSQAEQVEASAPSTSYSSSRDLHKRRAAEDIIATKFIDEALDVAMGSTSVNTINKGDYQQVVLLGDALDTRPFRTLWPKDTLFFMVAPAEAHKFADAALKAAGAKVPPGCLLRRVNADLSRAHVDGDFVFLPQLERAGFQGKNLSAWAVQGLESYGLDTPGVHGLLNELACASAYHSLMSGQLPSISRKAAEHILADVGLLSTVLPYGTDATHYGRWTQDLEQDQAPAGPSSSGEESARWIFSSQQIRLSVAQMDVYTMHRAAAEEVDEDFFGNFS